MLGNLDLGKAKNRDKSTFFLFLKKMMINFLLITKFINKKIY